MKSATLKIEGTSCNGCAEGIKGLISAEPGVRGAGVSHTAGETRILYDPRAMDEGQFVKIVERPDYRVLEQAS